MRLKSAIVAFTLAAASFVIGIKGGEFANLTMKQPFDAVTHGKPSKATSTTPIYRRLAAGIGLTSFSKSGRM